MNTTKAISYINKIFRQYNMARSRNRAKIITLPTGKLYELYVLADLIEELSNQGCSLSFISANNSKVINFKQSPGKIKKQDSHFIITCPDGKELYIFLNIEFRTLSYKDTQRSDRSNYHEIDIIVTNISSGYPSYHNILLGVECKCVAKFKKSILKEVLGVRRELGLLSSCKGESLLSSYINSRDIEVPMDPRTEYRLAFIDPNGKYYENAGRVFGVEFKHIEP